MTDTVTDPQAAEVTTAEEPRVYRLGDLQAELNQSAEELYSAAQGNKPLGVKTGINAVDELIGGILQPGLHAVHGGPGVGKTAFALQVAAECGCPALFVTCEMAPLELMRRITARVTSTFLGKFKTGELTPDEVRARGTKAAEECPDLAILDAARMYVPAFQTSYSSTNLFDLAEILRGDSEHFLIVVDSLHSWAAKALENQTEYEYLNTAIGSLTSLAAALRCPVLAVVERNRSSMREGGLSAGAGTRKIEYSAETVIELDADSESGADANHEKTVNLKVSKNRNGEIGRTVSLKFNGALQSFREV